MSLITFNCKGTFLCCLTGTFAVVSLMLGGVVDKSDCFPPHPVDQNSSSHSEAFPETNIAGNVDHMNNVTHDADAALKHDLMMCKVGYVMAVSMMGGIYQVTVFFFK